MKDPMNVKFPEKCAGRRRQSVKLVFFLGQEKLEPLMRALIGGGLARLFASKIASDLIRDGHPCSSGLEGQAISRSGNSTVSKPRPLVKLPSGPKKR
jgi:hypothetical protein